MPDPREEDFLLGLIADEDENDDYIEDDDYVEARKLLDRTIKMYE